MSQDKVFTKKNIFYPKDISGEKNILNTKPKNKYREKSGIFHQPTVSKAWSPFTVHQRCARPQKIQACPLASQELRARSHHPMLLKFQPRMCNTLTSRMGFRVYPSCVALTEHRAYVKLCLTLSSDFSQPLGTWCCSCKRKAAHRYKKVPTSWARAHIISSHCWLKLKLRGERSFNRLFMRFGHFMSKMRWNCDICSNIYMYAMYAVIYYIFTYIAIYTHSPSLSHTLDSGNFLFLTSLLCLTCVHQSQSVYNKIRQTVNTNCLRLDFCYLAWDPFLSLFSLT